MSLPGGAALGALALLALFIAGISSNLARGRKPNCHCFGQLYSAPAGPETLARNSILAAVALFVLSQGPAHPGLSLGAWLLSLSTVERIALFGGPVALALIALQGWFLLQLFQQHGRLLVRLDALEAQLASGGRVPVPPAPPRREVGLKVGTLAPAFELPDLQGTKFSLNTLRAPGRPLLLVFSNPGCGPCTSLMPDLARWQKEFADRLLHAYLRSGVKVQCFDIAPTNGHATLAETLTTFSLFMDPTIIVNRNAFCDYDDASQLATLFHESMHLDVPYHDPDQRLADNNTDVDRFYACALLCFAPPSSNTQCSCVTCLGTNKCDKRCDTSLGFKTRSDDFGAFCECPIRRRWYKTCYDCVAACTSGLQCFGYNHCGPVPGACPATTCPPK